MTPTQEQVEAAKKLASKVTSPDGMWIKEDTETIASFLASRDASMLEAKDREIAGLKSGAKHDTEVCLRQAERASSAEARVKELEANISVMNSRTSTDAKSYERDQYLIAALRKQLTDATARAVKPWREAAVGMIHRSDCPKKGLGVCDECIRAIRETEALLCSPNPVPEVKP